MRTETTSFYSDGLRLSGTFFRSDERPGGRLPLVIPCSGFTGLCSIHPARFARYLTPRGYTCFGFDYRGFAESEGERGRVLLEEQVRDIMHAAAFAMSDPRVDSQSCVLLGWGMGAGLVIDAARSLDVVAGIAAVNGFYVGERFQRAHRSEEEFGEFLRIVANERAERARTGTPRRGDPFDIYPLDTASRRYVDDVLRANPDYDTHDYSYELADSILRWDVEAMAPSMDIPLLVAHGDENRLHLPEEAQSIYDAYGGEKELFWLEGAGHTEFMDDEDPLFQKLAGRIEEWLTRQPEVA